MKNCSYIVFLFFFCNTAFAQFTDLELAKKKYESKDFKASLDMYLNYHSKGYSSTDLYYNIGNCYFKQDSIGKSVLWYERALKQNPNDSKTASNLKIAKTNIKDNIPELNSFFLFTIWDWLKNLTSSNTWGILFVLCLWISVGSFVFNYLYKTNKNYNRLIALMVVSFLSCLLFLVISIIKYHEEQHPTDAIMISDNIPFRTVPDESGTIIFSIREGNKIEILESIGTWSKIKISNGEQGWLPTYSFERI